MQDKSLIVECFTLFAKNVTYSGRLLQLVLGCAVHCDEKEEHIKKIMGLEEHVQTGVMQCIQVLTT